MNWTALVGPQQPQAARSVCYKSGDDWFATNDSDVWSSTDNGASWSVAMEDPGSLTGVFNAMVYDGSGTWVVVGNSGALGFSTDDWSTASAATDSGYGSGDGPFGTSHIWGVVYCAGSVKKFIAVGASGKIAYSDDGDHWTAATSGVSDTLNAIATDNKTIVVVGNSATILVSTDGVNWSTVSGASGDLESVACDVIGAGMR